MVNFSRLAKNLSIKAGMLAILLLAITIQSTHSTPCHGQVPDQPKTAITLSIPEITDVAEPSIQASKSRNLNREHIPSRGQNLTNEGRIRRTYNNLTEGDILEGTLTFYCVCEICCGKTDGITASGLRIQNYVQPATPIVAGNWLPLGSIVKINGVKHLVADRGGSDLDQVGRLDVFTPEGHAAALQKGRIHGVEIKLMYLPATEY